MQKYLLVVSSITAFVLFLVYGRRIRARLGLSDDLDTTFFGQTIAFQGPSGYCGVRSNDVPVVDCRRTQVTDSERFDAIKTGECRRRPDGRTECQVAFRNKLTGKVCADEGNRVLCNRPTPGPWERHAFIKHAGLREFSWMGGKSGNARRSCQDKGAGGLVCDGAKEAFGLSSIFRWSLASDTVAKSETTTTTSSTSATATPAAASSAPPTTPAATTINDIAKAIVKARDANATPSTTTSPLPSSATVPSPSPSQATTSSSYQYCMDATQGNMEAFERCMATATSDAASPTNPTAPRASAVTPSPEPSTAAPPTKTEPSTPSALSPSTDTLPTSDVPATSSSNATMNSTAATEIQDAAIAEDDVDPEILPSSATLPSPSTTENTYKDDATDATVVTATATTTTTTTTTNTPETITPETITVTSSDGADTYTTAKIASSDETAEEDSETEGSGMILAGVAILTVGIGGAFLVRRLTSP